MSYKVQFLNDKEFNELPGNDMASKVGVAYPSHGMAYARRTGIGVLDAFTAIHELEHLEGVTHDEHYDSENQCYYKGFGDIVKTVAPIALMFIPGIGQALGGALSSVGGAFSGALGSVPGVGGALSGAASGIGNAAGGLMGIGGQSAGADRALLQSSASPGGFSSRVRSAPNVFSTGRSVGSGMASGAGGSALSQFGKGASEAVGSQVGGSLASNLFGEEPQGLGAFQMPSEGSSSPSFSSTGPNIVAGASGTGSQGGAGGAPGSIGGGTVSKLKQYLAQRDQTDQYSGGSGGGNF